MLALFSFITPLLDACIELPVGLYACSLLIFARRSSCTLLCVLVGF